MTIHYHETYEIITEESAVDGDVEESGFTGENLETDFRDMVSMLEGAEPSCSEPDAGCWYTVYGEMDMYSGDYENRSYHPATDRDGRYMLKAYQATH